MNKSVYCIGLMSGTSLDGVDLVYVKFTIEKKYEFKIISCETFPYSDAWLNRLKDAFHYNKKDLKQIDVDYGQYLGELIQKFIHKNNIKSLDFIASHGHTIHHKPNEEYTLQIGDGKTIASNTKTKVICDFRSQDVALGGQGAPLVPIGDKLLFNEYTYCLNLGGFANISFEQDDTRVAFDICAVNTILNFYANKLGLAYDDKGIIAKSGKINTDLLSELNKLEFYKKSAPKSLGFEYVESILLPLLTHFKLSERDLMCTYIEHIAIQITNNLTKQGHLLITGGGVFNTFLIDRIRFHSSIEIIIPDVKTIDFKEALIFAFLGLRKAENKINCLQSVTGASKDHSSGVVFE
ncbi:MAG: anhydro-N-acetylmuramic acid kinase [Flavobacteriaceae bacterium]